MCVGASGRHKESDTWWPLGARSWTILRDGARHDGYAELMTFARQGSAGGGREQAHSAKCAFQSGTRACQEPGASGSKKERRRK